jgi:Inhibitor of Apoptosis domain
VPAREHLKLSSHCGWAIIKNSGHEAEDVDTMEDPTEERFYEARKSTFGSRWPHEQKRGWLCKTEKMAAAGWHFAPTPEFDDFVSCAYCNLSLDGWEPKDSPL